MQENNKLSKKDIADCLQYFICNFKEILSKFTTFCDLNNNLEILLFLYSYLVFIIKKLGKISKNFSFFLKNSKKKSETLNFLIIYMKREIKLLITNFLIFYRGLITKIRKIINTHLLNSFLSNTEIETFENFSDSFINKCFNSIQKIIHNLKEKKRINKFFTKYKIVFNFFSIYIDEQLKVFFILK